LATKLGRTLDAIVQRCLEKDPAARFPSAAQLADIFAALGRGEPVQFTAMDSYAQAWPRRKSVRRLAVKVGIAVGVGLAVAGLALAIMGGARSARHAELSPSAARSASAAAAASAPESPKVEEISEIVVTFESEPAGAQARLVGHDELLGLTPFQRSFPQGDGA